MRHWVQLYLIEDGVLLLILPGKVNVDELRYVLTGIGSDKLTDEEVDEILKDAPVADGNLEYESFLQSMIAH